MQRIECDVLVIGGGLAGAWAALRAGDFPGRVVLAEKGKTGRGGQSAFSGANILCPLSTDDLAAWRAEIVNRGEFMCDQDWVDAVLAEMEGRTRDMEQMGVEFEKDSDGRWTRSVGLAHQVTRLSTVNSLQMMDCLRRRLAAKAVVLQDRTMITHLLTSDGAHPTRGNVTGAVGFNSLTAEPIVIEAGSTVMATGGSGHVDLSGDGICQAFEAGAEVTGMEFARLFDKMAFGQKWVEVHLNSFQRMGMLLRNARGERFMERYSPLKERSSRHILGLSILVEHLEGRGPTYMDLTHLKQEEMEKLHSLPAVARRLKGLARDGADFYHGKVEINITSGFMHFHGGGIKHNLFGETSLPGLYAAGEAGGYPAHGTYSVGGMNLAHCCVGGYRAGEYASRFAREVRPEVDQVQVEHLVGEALGPLSTRGGSSPDDAWWEFQKILSPAHLSVFRTGEGIRKLLAIFQDRKKLKLSAGDPHALVKAHKSRNYVRSAELIMTASLEREETRGCNIRADFPYRDDAEWLQRIVLTRDGDRIRSRRQAIPIYRYPVKPDRRERIPFAFPIPRT
ncbi:MAG: FAD-binding protein [Chloroflexi bacterium]|nr:FAD-binding protein [Chloroflexota bacterium]